MKFNKIYMAAACAAALGMAACSEVTEPVYQNPDPSTFLMNTPPLQDQYYELTEGGTFDLTLNGQPSYGFSAVTQYRAQVSLDGNFDSEENYRELTPAGTGTLSRMTLNDIDLAVAICELRGISEQADYTDAGEQTLYFRGVAFIEGVESSRVVTSNVVTLNRVQSFFATAQPGIIYVIGNYAGDWISPEESNADALIPYELTENSDAIRSKIYYGDINFVPTTETACVFRFYTALTGWDDDSVGCSDGPDADTAQEFDFGEGQTLEHGIAKTKDSFQLNGYRGGISFTVNLNTMKAIMVATTIEE